jgi:protein-disulfide isomerase
LGVFLVTGIVVLVGIFLVFRHFSKVPQSPEKDKTKIEYQLPENSPRLGNANAPVKMIEFADFQCPYCREFHEIIFPQLKKDYIDTGKASFYFQHYAFLGEESIFAAEASECANLQNKFWEYHDALYEQQNSENRGFITDSFLNGIAKSLQLNESLFADCMAQHAGLTRVKNETQDAQAAGVHATPTLSINGQRIEGVSSYTVLQAAIEAALQAR